MSAMLTLVSPDQTIHVQGVSTVSPLTEQTLYQLRGVLLADSAAQDRIAAAEDRRDAIDLLAEVAGFHGISASSDQLYRALLPDPLDLERFQPRPANMAGRPSEKWLPVGIGTDGAQYVVDWAHFGNARLTESFFETALRRARSRPISQLMKCRTPLAALMDDEGIANQPPPDGIIFHMSRCGSTLVSQVLAALPGVVALSEPAPFDQAIHIAEHQRDAPLELRTGLIRNVAAALLSDRCGDACRRFIKVDCWHAMAMPLIRAAFPGTPWIFLFRDPVDVMLSHQAMPGSHTIPESEDLQPGQPEPEFVPHHVFAAKAIARVCHAGADNAHLGGGLFIDYAELPHAIVETILPHFGISRSEYPADVLDAVLARDSKQPRMPWDPGRLPSPNSADADLLAATEQYLAPAVARLAALAGERTAA